VKETRPVGDASEIGHPEVVRSRDMEVHLNQVFRSRRIRVGEGALRLFSPRIVPLRPTWRI
jgi:hypothetical protein